MDVGDKLSSIRKNKELSVYRLSKITDISENYIHEIEKGKKNPSVFILDKLLSAFGITLSEFFNEQENAMYPSAFEIELINNIRLMGAEKAASILQIAKYINGEDKQNMFTIH